MVAQLALFGHEDPGFDAAFGGLVRRELEHGAWIEHGSGWLRGHAALHDALVQDVAWKETTQVIYDKEVVTPRLVAMAGDCRGAPPPILAAMSRALSLRYGVDLDRISLALYRDGNDSVAWHRDRVLRERDTGLVATVSVGEPRPFFLRPRGGGAPSIKFMLGWGDLMVMGGTCQRTWEHTVPKHERARGTRLAIMFRHGADYESASSR